MVKTNVILYENGKEIDTLHLTIVPNIGDTIKTPDGYFKVKERVIYTHPKCEVEDLLVSVERLLKNPVTGQFDYNAMSECIKKQKEEIIVNEEKTRKLNYEQNCNILGIKNLTFEQFLLANEKAKKNTENYCKISSINSQYCKGIIYRKNIDKPIFVEDPWYVIYCVVIEHCYVTNTDILKILFKKNH